MATKIIPKKSSTASKVPLPTDLEVGEIAINLADQKFYSKTSSGTVVEIGGAVSSSPFNQNLNTTDDVDFSSVTAGSIQLTGGTGTQGTLTWNSDEETIDLDANGTTLQLGQELFWNVKNQTGVTIPNGTPVMATGTVGTSGRITVAPMDATDNANTPYFLGITTEELLDGADGKVTHFGKVRDLDTSSYSEGTTLYLSPTTVGAFTTTEPSMGQVNLPIAFVINSHANNGVIAVRVKNINVNAFQPYDADTVIDGNYVHTDNNYTTTEKSKLAGIEAGAEVNTVDSVNTQTGAVVLDADDISDASTTNKFTTAAGISKLAGIEAGATADQTGSEIKSLYEAEANTNAYTDAEKSKLGAVEANADVTDTANVTAAGALMDSEVTNLNQVKTFDSSDYATAAQGTLANSALQAGDNISELVNDSGYVTTDTNTTYTAGSGLSLVGTEFTNTAPDQTVAITGGGNVTVTGTYPNFTIASTDTNTQLSSEQVQDIVGAMFTGNTESGISVVYQDTDGTIDINVNDPTITLSGDVSGSATMTDLGNVNISVTIADDSHNHIIANVDGLQTALDGKVDDAQVLTDVPAGAVFTDTVYSHPSTHPATMITTTDEFAYSNSANVQDVLDDLDQAIANVNAKDPVLTLTGDATGTATFTNLGNASLAVTIADDSHNHTIANVDGLQAALDGKTTESYVDTQISNLVDTAPATLDTLNELAAALGDDPNFATTVSNSIGTKANNTTTISAGSGLTGGGDLSANRTISHADTSTQASLTALTGASVVSDIDVDTYGHVTNLSTRNMTLADLGFTGETNATADQTITAGAGLTGGGTGNVTLNHADTSTQASVNNSGGTVIQDITLDTYGHLTGITSANLDDRYYTESEADSRFVNVTGDTMTGDLKINKSDAAIYLNDSSGSPTQQGMRIRAEAVDSNLPGSEGIGIVFEEDPANGSPDTTPAVITTGEFYAQSNQKVFHDNYHPNADKWTTARTLSLSGDASGSVSWDGSANATLSVAVANDSHTHDGRYYTESEADSRFLSSNVSDVYAGRVLEFGNAGNGANTSGAFLTIEGNTDANGEGSGRLMFREHNSSTDGADNYGMSIGYRGGSTSVTTAMGNSWTGLGQIGNGEWGMWGHDNNATGVLIAHGPRNGSYADFTGLKVGGSNVFHDGYHPNADKWTTARTLSLTGDVSGSTSWDGSGNASISVTAASDVHMFRGDITSQDWNTLIDGTETGYYTVLNATGSNKAPAYTYGTVVNWAKAGQAKLQLYGPHNGSENGTGLWFRTGWNTDYDPWAEIWHSNNDGSGSGLDADLLDGQQGSYYYPASNPNGYTSYTANQALNTNNSPTFSNLYVATAIYHSGDTNTYMQFHAADQWRVVTGGAERLEVNNSKVTSTEPVHAPAFSSNHASVSGSSFNLDPQAATAFTQAEMTGNASFTIGNPASAVQEITFITNSGASAPTTDGSTSNISLGNLVESPTFFNSILPYSSYNRVRMAHNNNGTKLYLWAENSIVYQYSLSTAYDHATASYDNKSKALDSNLKSIAWNSNGTTLYYVRNDNFIYSRAASTAYDISSLGGVSEFDVASQPSATAGMTFNDNGTKMVLVSGGNAFNYYNLSTAYNPATASYQGQVSNSTNSIDQLDWSPDGHWLIAGRFGNFCGWYMSTANNPATISGLTQYTTYQNFGSAGIYGIAFDRNNPRRVVCTGYDQESTGEDLQFTIIFGQAYTLSTSENITGSISVAPYSQTVNKLLTTDSGSTWRVL